MWGLRWLNFVNFVTFKCFITKFLGKNQEKTIQTRFNELILAYGENIFKFNLFG